MKEEEPWRPTYTGVVAESEYHLHFGVEWEPSEEVHEV